jgi:hypothetical protein
MKIIALEQETPGSNPTDFQPHLKNEAMAVWQLVKDGVIREAYFDQSQHTAVLILECASVEEADQALSVFPLVENGLITFKLIPLEPYTGFERLFISI